MRNSALVEINQLVVAFNQFGRMFASHPLRCLPERCELFLIFYSLTLSYYVQIYQLFK